MSITCIPSVITSELGEPPSTNSTHPKDTIMSPLVLIVGCVTRCWEYAHVLLVTPMIIATPSMHWLNKERSGVIVMTMMLLS